MAFSVLRILTYVLGIVGIAMSLPLGVAVKEGEAACVYAFLFPAAASGVAAVAFWLMAKGRPRVFDVRNAFGIVAGTLPYRFLLKYISSIKHLHENSYFRLTSWNLT